MVLVVGKKIFGSKMGELATPCRKTCENLFAGDGVAVVKGHYVIVICRQPLPPGIALKTGVKSTPPGQDSWADAL
jgi:hypothetical protein